MHSAGPALLFIGGAFPGNLAISRPSTPVRNFPFPNQPPRTPGTVPCGTCAWYGIRLKPGAGVRKPPALFQLGWPARRIPYSLRLTLGRLWTVCRAYIRGPSTWVIRIVGSRSLPCYTLPCWLEGGAPPQAQAGSAQANTIRLTSKKIANAFFMMLFPPF